jgi:hypothetical protein
MKRSWKILAVLSAVALLAASVSFAQVPNENYGGWLPSVQSRNIPAGSVVDPGSQLLYIVDTGVNLLNKGFTSAQLASLTPAELMRLHTGNPAWTGRGSETQTNFISITNTHPTRAVTVQFRYFNDMCEDLLDFLVVITCNDTLMFNPMDFEIPGAVLGTTPINAAHRLFGPDVSANFPAIRGLNYRTGRILLFATASGTTTDDDWDAELRFPFELQNTHGWSRQQMTGICNINSPYIGTASGLVPQNLHVFNASAVSFNYLVGHQTVAVPKGFIQGVADDQDAFLAYGLNAWARPAVDLSQDVANTLPTVTDPIGVFGDGDGPPLLVDYLILAGSENQMRRSDTVTRVGGGATVSTTNFYYLRNEVHGGTTELAPEGIAGGQSRYGAMAWNTLHTLDPVNQRAELLSFVDDYDGSKNVAVAAQVAGVNVFDRSYNLTGAQTRYILQIYDNKEQKLSLVGEVPPNISPPPIGQQLANLRLIVDCLQVWILGSREATTLRPGLSIANLYEFTNLVRDGSGSFAGLGATVNPLRDASQGWIRFVRDNRQSRVVGATTQWGGTLAPTATAVSTNTGTPSFVTIGQVVTKFEGFGAAWWMPSSAFDPAVSNAPLTDVSP